MVMGCSYLTDATIHHNYVDSYGGCAGREICQILYSPINIKQNHGIYDSPHLNVK
jgi:hypothetical protein